ncbi:MAG: VanW family protein [Alphaproteobacteria bacterium]|nr:VanW family protein [Alphaproteobacteria bacterium]
MRLAADRVHDSWISEDRPFSFWRTVGRIREEDGYRAGLEIHGGCLVPSLGGGVCLLSNALFEAAVRADWVVLERHGHSKEAVPHRGEVWGLDATVLYPHVDLRFAPRQGAGRITARVEDEHLVVELFGSAPPVRVELEAAYDRRHGDIRTNRVLRRRYAGDVLLGVETVARSRRQILHAEQQRRTCRTCGETACPSRERFLSVETA